MHIRKGLVARPLRRAAPQLGNQSKVFTLNLNSEIGDVPATVRCYLPASNPNGTVCPIHRHLCHGIVGMAEPTAFLHVRTFSDVEIAAIRVMKYECAYAGLRVHHHSFGELYADLFRLQ